MTFNRHWTENDMAQNIIKYTNRSNFCSKYLLDKTLTASGIYFDPHLPSITENERVILFRYYTRPKIENLVLRCPVRVKQQYTDLFFMKYKNIHNHADSSYFVLASVSDSFNSPLYVLMYTTKQMIKYEEKNHNIVTPSSVQEERYVYENYISPLDFRKLLKVSDQSSSAENDSVVLFGKAAERVFITATSFYFINLKISMTGWLIDNFIRLADNMRKGKHSA